MLVLWVEGTPPSLQPLPNDIEAFVEEIIPLIRSGATWAIWEVDCDHEEVTPIWPPLWATDGAIEIGERALK